MRLPTYIIRELQSLRVKIPTELWPEIDKIIEWAGDRVYEQRRKKRNLVFGDYTAQAYGNRFLVTDVNGDAEYTEPGLVTNQWEAIDLVMAARRTRAEFKKGALNKGG